MNTANVIPIPAFKDNYIWALRSGAHVAIVDPGDAQPVLDYLSEEHLTLVAILATHHHGDHVGGIARLLQQHAVPVFGPRGEDIPTVGTRLAEGDEIEIPQLGLRFSVIDIPGHTSGHIAYYCATEALLFCGDTLFACGCGRVFEGTPAQMYRSLAKLAALPDDTAVYCAHEYTLANIAFARAVEPDNVALAERAKRDAKTRAAGRPTLPTSIGLEKATNPFLRSEAPAVIAAAQSRGLQGADPVKVFATIRQWKNEF
jgi:hydroxyacylglutathione hydrolase